VFKSQQLQLGALGSEASMQGIRPQCFLHFPTFGYRGWQDGLGAAISKMLLSVRNISASH
jgi:hypothetical protein